MGGGEERRRGESGAVLIRSAALRISTKRRSLRGKSGPRLALQLNQSKNPVMKISLSKPLMQQQFGMGECVSGITDIGKSLASE